MKLYKITNNKSNWCYIWSLKQRDFITNELENIDQNGNVAIIYKGEIFLEVKRYLQDEGFKVQRCNNEILVAQERGLPLYLITVDENKGDLSCDKKEANSETDDVFYKVIPVEFNEKAVAELENDFLDTDEIFDDDLPF